MAASIPTLFQQLTQGVYVIGVAGGEARNAFTAAWVMQVSFRPLLLALSINPNNSSYRLLQEAQAFSVNVLKKGQLDLAERYGRPAGTKTLTGTAFATGRLGVPLLNEALAWFECRAVNAYPAGDHVLVVAEVIDGKVLDTKAVPMTYRQTGQMDGAAALFPDAFGNEP